MTKLAFAKGVAMAALALALASGTAATPPARFTEQPVAGAHAAYDTEMFNLLKPGKSLVDGKAHFDPAFARSFDALLAQSAYVRAGKPQAAQAFLKKRLLSGPAPKPSSVALAPGGAQSWLFYRACQAHACDVTNLALLYQPGNARAVALLRIDGKTELLGQPTQDERALLTALDAAQAEKLQ